MAKLGMLKNVKFRTGTRDSRAVALTVKDIPIGDISIKGNIRAEYTDLDELRVSIRQHGLLQPITVYPDGDGYTVKTGHRRYLAYRALYREEPERFHSIRCILSDTNNTSIIQLVENVQRVDLSQLDLFKALKELKAQGMTLKQIAEVMGKTEGYIKKIFVGINDIQHNEDLFEAIGYAGVTIEDVVETKGIPNEKERLNLLEQRKNGTINRAEMREKVRALKTSTPEKETPCVFGTTAQKIHVSIETLPDLKKIIIHQVNGGNANQLSSIEEDLRGYFTTNSEKYHLEKLLPVGGENENEKQGA
jgi:ParB family chromosome partitioning protein